MASAFEEAGLVGAVGYVERCNPAIQELRRRLAAGELGQVYQIQTRRQGPFPARISDVGVVKDLATHDVDLTAYIAASPYRQVSAQVAHRSGREFEDMVVASGVLESGVIVNHVVNWLSPMKERTTVVIGERGAFVADTMNGDLIFFANGTVPTTWDRVAHFRGVTEGDVIRYALPKREPLAVEQENFRDAVQGLGTEEVSLNALGADAASISAHKVGGPKGAGALVLGPGIQVEPLLAGGSQERGMRPGTHAVPAIVGMGAAVEAADAERHELRRRMAGLQSLLEGLLRGVPGVRVNGSEAPRGVKHVNVSVADVDGESLLMALDDAGVEVSAGSACAASSRATSCWRWASRRERRRPA